MRQATEAENIRVNAALVRNLLSALAPVGSVEHVALVTGLKHYLGPFEAYGKGALPETPFREAQPRLDVPNFYYAQEDEVFAAAERDGFGWTVHRPHTIIGYAVGNAMNMGVTLAVYGTICRELGRPFVFPGSEMQWNGLTDVTDARVLAGHLLWAGTTPAARNQAFNIVNGDIFRWKWMWARLAAHFGVEPLPPPPGGLPLETQLADAGPLWVGITWRSPISMVWLRHGTRMPILAARSRSSPICRRAGGWASSNTSRARTRFSISSGRCGIANSFPERRDEGAVTSPPSCSNGRPRLQGNRALHPRADQLHARRSSDERDCLTDRQRGFLPRLQPRRSRCARL
jgi:nucleoside-diphosphate-sugar epimerase